MNTVTVTELRVHTNEIMQRVSSGETITVERNGNHVAVLLSSIPAATDGLTLATLCDMVLGEDAADRSNQALIEAVGRLLRLTGKP